MSEINCNVARDMIPLYLDDVLSRDSKELLKRHLDECEECRNELEKMKADVSVYEDRDINPFQKVKKHYARRIIIIVVLLLLIEAGVYLYVEMTWTPIRGYGRSMVEQDLEVVYIDDAFYLKTTNMAVRGDIVLVDQTDGNLSFYLGENILNHWHTSFVGLTKYTEIPTGFFHNKQIKSIRCCYKNGKEIKTLWKQGDELPVLQKEESGYSYAADAEWEFTIHEEIMLEGGEDSIP